MCWRSGPQMTVMWEWVGNFKSWDHCTHPSAGDTRPQLLPVFLPLPIYHGLSSFAPPHGSDHAILCRHSPKAMGPSSYKPKSHETMSHTVFSFLKADCLVCFVMAVWSVKSLTPVLFEKVVLRGLQPRRCRCLPLRILKLAFRWMALFITITDQSAPSPHSCSLDFRPPWPFPKWLFTWQMSLL